MTEQIVEFKAKILKERYSSEEFKIYVAETEDNIKKNNNGEVVIVGNIPTLTPNVECVIKAAVGFHKTFGIQYVVKNIKQDIPTDIDSSRKFLQEILTESQVNTLLEVYPDIIDRIMKNKPVDLNLTRGIKEKTYSVIRKKVLDNFALIELVERFGGIISFSVMKKLYDKYTSIQSVELELKRNPYKCLCDLSRVGFKMADAIILELESNKLLDFEEGNFKSSKLRMEACIDYCLEQNESNGNTCISIIELRKNCNELTPECIGHFVKVIKEDTEKYYLNNKEKKISTLAAFNTELYLATTILKMLKVKNDLGLSTEIYREVDGITLTDEQMGVLINSSKYQVSMLTAGAGCGKSASVNNLTTMLDDYKYKYILMTPTGKSSEVLSLYTGKDVGTIHRKLGYNPSSEIQWEYNEDNKLPYDYVIIDETSMVDIWLMKRVLEAIDIEKTKLILVFDSYQLTSVGCGNIVHDLLTSGIIPTTLLTKVFRFNEGGLMQIATKIRNCEEFLPNNFSGVKIFGAKKDFAYIELQQTQMISEIIKIYKKLLRDGYSIEEIMVLTAYNKGDYGTKVINKKIQAFIQESKDNEFFKRGDEKFYVGDKVLQIVNNYHAKSAWKIDEEEQVFNGNTGIVHSIYNDSIVVDFNNKLIKYEREDLNQLELGYCISIHKSQGDAAKQVIVIAPKAHTYMLNSNLLYVAATRAKERLFMIGNIITINRAIKKKENFIRCTWLKNMLTNIKR